MEAELGNGNSIQQIYTLPENGYSIDYKLKFNGVSGFWTEMTANCAYGGIIILTGSN